MVHRRTLAYRRALPVLQQRPRPPLHAQDHAVPMPELPQVLLGQDGHGHAVMHASRVGYQKWAIAIYLMTTRIKGISSMNMQREVGVTQKTAWYMCHRIGKCWEQSRSLFEGPVEVDEVYIGGKEKKLRAGQGTVGKAVVAGAKDRDSDQISAAVVGGTKRADLHQFTHERIDLHAMVFTDDLKSYAGLRNHAVVRHGVGEYVSDQAHINGMESFWALLKRGYHGIYHRMSPAQVPNAG